MATRVRIHNDLQPLRRRAIKLGWTVEQTSTNQVEWKDAEGKHVETHSTSMYGGPLLTAIKNKIKKKLDDQVARERALKAIQDREAGDAALTQLGHEMATGITTPASAPASPNGVFSDVVESEPVAAHPYSAVPEPFAGPVLPEVEDKLRMNRRSEAGPRFKPTYRKVDVRDIRIFRVDDVDEHGNKGYQRPMNYEETLDIALKFDWDKFGQVELSYRDGVLWSLDGQQRLGALELTDRVPESQKLKVPAMVFTGMTLQDEADYYLAKNTERKVVHPVHVWQARRVTDPKVREVEAILARYGYQVKTSPSNDTIAAVARLEQIYDDFGPVKLDYAIRAINQAWHHEWTVSAVLINAVGLVFGVFDGVDVDRVGRTLQQNIPTGWTAWAKTVTASGEQGTQAVWLARRIVAEYDRKLSPERQLKDFDGAHRQYLSDKRSETHMSERAKARAVLAAKPRPGSWLTQG